MESLYLLILLFFIIILVFPIGFNIRANYDCLNNEGMLCFKIWFIKVIIAKFCIKNKNIVLRINHKKKVEKEIELGEPAFKFIISFQNEMKNKIKLREIETVTKIGVGEADKSALVSTLVTDIILMFFARLKMNNPTCHFRNIPLTDFDNESLFLAISAKFSFSVQDIIYSFLASFLKTKGDLKYERIWERKYNR